MLGDKIKQELQHSGQTSIIKLVELILAEALAAHVSDIHFDPQRTEVLVRFRLDGILQEPLSLPKQTHAELISRIKVMAGLRTDVHSVAQDGRFQIPRLAPGENHPVDVRVSIIPTYY